MQKYGNLFAKIYNERWNSFPERIAKLICEFFEKNSDITGEKRLLDLFCGTGQLAHFFLEQDFIVTGVDLSKDMLVFAEERNKDYIEKKRATFFCGNAAEFESKEKYNLITATYDAVNHLKSFSELKKLFSNSYNALEKKGFFIFDLNTKKGLKNWDGLDIQNSDDITLIRKGIFFEEENRAYMHIFGFVQGENNLYEKFDEKMFNTAFEMAEVEKELYNAGFEEVIFTETFNYENILKNPETAGRVLIIAKK